MTAPETSSKPLKSHATGGFLQNVIAAVSILATIITGSMIPQCQSQSYARGQADARIEVEGELDKKKSEVIDRDRRIDELAQRMDKSRAEFDANREATDARLGELEKQLADCNQSLSVATSESDSRQLIDSLRAQAQAARQELTQIRASLTASEQTAADLNSRLKDQTTENGRLADRITALELSVREKEVLLAAARAAASGADPSISAPPSGASAPETGASDAGTVPEPLPRTLEAGGCTFILTSCRAEAGAIIVEVRVTSPKDRTIGVYGDSRTEIFDEQGRATRASSVATDTDSRGGSMSIRMIQNIPVTVRWRFTLADAAPALLSKISLKSSAGGDLVFRNVPVAR